MSYPTILANIPNAVAEAVDDERGRQLRKFGNQLHKSNDLWALILAEEFGEVCKDILDGRNVRTELVQLAAVAIAWIEAVDARQEVID